MKEPDFRFKMNVVSVDPVRALARILKLRAVDFQWVNNKTPARGFITHELVEIEPLAVGGSDDAKGPRVVNQSVIVADLVATVQVLNDRIAALEESKK
jgi:Chaperone of endosialidase